MLTTMRMFFVCFFFIARVFWFPKKYIGMYLKFGFLFDHVLSGRILSIPFLCVIRNIKTIKTDVRLMSMREPKSYVKVTWHHYNRDVSCSLIEKNAYNTDLFWVGGNTISFGGKQCDWLIKITILSSCIRKQGLNLTMFDPN